MNIVQYEIIFYVSVFGRFLYGWKKFHALFLSHFNKSSIPVGYWKSLPHLSWTNFMNIFQYEIIFYNSVCGRFLYGWTKFHALLFLPHFYYSSIPVGYCKSLPHLSWTNFRNVFHPCRILKISSTFKLKKTSFTCISSFSP